MASYPVRRALLSVSDKTGLLEFAQYLASKGVELLSTGGTANMLREAGLNVKDVSEHTGFPEMLDGRVKTLHPMVHGGLLGRRDLDTHKAAMDEHNITNIDLVVINLYPFEATVARGANYDDCIENIDIGGPAMVRSAAKNHDAVTVITDVADYARVKDAMETNDGDTTLGLRKELAAKAYARTAAYDAAISSWFAGVLGQDYPERLNVSFERKQTLRYGENSHQSAAFYAWPGEATGIAAAEQLQGKELSYNNLNDADAALGLVQEFEAPAVVIIKHANPCGVAVGKDVTDAFQRAYACDTTSAFGGIIAVNRAIDDAFVEALGSLFLEVVIAPAISDSAKEKFAAKKNLRLLILPELASPARRSLKTIAGGLLVQDEDRGQVQKSELKVVTDLKPSDAQIEDMLFAFRVAKHVKSNAIVMVKDGATVGIGAGQMSRVDSVRTACRKAEDAGLSTQGAVLASDAFFPFDDNVVNAAEAGIAAIIQPGGSIRDDEVIATANAKNITMVFSGMRHFRH